MDGFEATMLALAVVMLGLPLGLVANQVVRAKRARDQKALGQAWGMVGCIGLFVVGGVGFYFWSLGAERDIALERARKDRAAYNKWAAAGVEVINAAVEDFDPVVKINVRDAPRKVVATLDRDSEDLAHTVAELLVKAFSSKFGQTPSVDVVGPTGKELHRGTAPI